MPAKRRIPECKCGICPFFALLLITVVIAIIAILAGMLLPALGAVKETGKQANCTNNLKQIGTALAIYENYFSRMPTAGVTTIDGGSKAAEMAGCFDVLRNGYLDEPKSFMCPSCTQAEFQAAATGATLSDKAISYGYFTYSEDSANSISTSTCAPSSVIAADAQPNSVWNHDKKGAFLRIDSSVSRPGGVNWCSDIATANARSVADVQGNLVL